MSETLPIQHQSVAELAAEQNVLTLHGILDNVSVSGNSLLMAEHSDFRTKLSVCLAFEPSISTSVITPGNPERANWAPAGLLLVDGLVTGIHDGDAGSVATGVKTRSTNAEQRAVDIEAVMRGDNNWHNEVTVDAPVFGGLFWRPSHAPASTSVRAETLPDYLTAAAKEFSLPLYEIGEDSSVRPITSIDEHGKYDTGDPVAVTEIPPITEQESKEAAQDTLLLQGIFRVAHRERELISSSEKGRLAYYAELPDVAAAIPDGVTQVFRTSSGTGVSSTVRLTNQDGALIIETRMDGGTIGTGRGTKQVANGVTDIAAVIGRQQYAPSFPWIGDSTVSEKYHMPTYEQVSNSSIPYLDLVDTMVATARNVASNSESIHRQGMPNSVLHDMQTFLETTAYRLYAYADEARSCDDIEQAARAEHMAELLCDRDQYDKLRAKRIDTHSRFKLAPEDLSRF